MADEAGQASLAKALAESERKRADLADLLERERAARQAAVAEANARASILAVLARELRAPMNAAIAWSQLVRRELLSQSGREHALGVVERNIDGSMRLIDDLLDIVPERASARGEDLALSELVATIFANVDRRAKERKLTLALRLEARAEIHAERQRVERLVTRLVMSALELAGEGTTVDLHLEALDDRVRVETSFEGPPSGPCQLPASWEDIVFESGVARPIDVSLFLFQKLADGLGGRGSLIPNGATSTLRLELPIMPAVPVHRSDELTVSDLLGHELRSPLQVLLIGIDLVRTRIRDSADELPRDWLLERLDSLEHAVERLGDVANRAAELGTSRESPRRREEAVELRVTIERVLARLEHDLAWAGCSVDVRIPPDLDATVMWNAVDIETVLANLLSNAMKYGARKPIDVVVGGDADTVTVSVHDRGPGIDPTEREHVFERFYRARGSRHLPGLGVGLAIVKAAVVAHGGTVTVGGERGEGATFRLVLPRGAISARPSPSESPREAGRR